MIVRHWFKCFACLVAWSTPGPPSATTDQCWMCGGTRTEFAWTQPDQPLHDNIFMGEGF